MADNAQDQKDYQDYLAYQKYLAEQSPEASSAPPSLSNIQDKLLSILTPGSASQKAASAARQATQTPEGTQELASTMLPGVSTAKMFGNPLIQAMTRASGYGMRTTDPLTNLIGGAGASVLGGAAHAVPAGFGRLKSTVKMAVKPQEAQEMAKNVLGTSTNNAVIKAQTGLNNLLEKSGKTVEINPKDFVGLNDKADAFIKSHVDRVSPYGQVPDKIVLPANEANNLRQIFDREVSYPKTTPEMSPGAIQKSMQDAEKLHYDRATELRAKLHDLGPEYDQAYNQASEAWNTSKKLGRSDRPISTLSSESPDLQARLQKIGGKDLLRAGAQQRSASEMRSGGLPSKAISGLKEFLKGTYQGNPATTVPEKLSWPEKVSTNVEDVPGYSFEGTGQAETVIPTEAEVRATHSLPPVPEQASGGSASGIPPNYSDVRSSYGLPPVEPPPFSGETPSPSQPSLSDILELKKSFGLPEYEAPPMYPPPLRKK